MCCCKWNQVLTKSMWWSITAATTQKWNIKMYSSRTSVLKSCLMVVQATSEPQNTCLIGLISDLPAVWTSSRPFTHRCSLNCSIFAIVGPFYGFPGAHLVSPIWLTTFFLWDHHHCSFEKVFSQCPLSLFLNLSLRKNRTCWGKKCLEAKAAFGWLKSEECVKLGMIRLGSFCLFSDVWFRPVKLERWTFPVFKELGSIHALMLPWGETF